MPSLGNPLSRSSYNEFQDSTAQSKGVMKSSILVEKLIVKICPSLGNPLSRSSYNEFPASKAQSKGVMKSSILVEKLILKICPSLGNKYPSVGAPITSFRPLRLYLRELWNLQFWSKNWFWKYAHPRAIPLSRSSYNEFQASTALS